MRFFESLIAVLVALWLTGNVQAGSILGKTMIFSAYGLFMIIAGIITLLIVWNFPNPRKLWEDFKTGRFRMR